MDGDDSKTNRRKRFFELALILILLALFLSAISSPPKKSNNRKAKARFEMAGIIAAINQYESVYGHVPTSSNLATNNSSDFTFGTFGTSAEGIGITNARGYQANNSEAMAILLDLTKFGNGRNTINADHSRNPQRTPFLNVKMSGDTNSPGLGLDGVYRDPWGNPYIITFDLNNDTKCRDAFYRLASVSEISPTSTSGFNRLFRFTPAPYNSPESRNAFEAQTTVMVWSLGPDGKADPSQKADAGVNKDNVISW